MFPQPPFSWTSNPQENYVLYLNTAQDKNEVILIANLTANSLSLLGCFFNLITTVWLDHSQKDIARMIIGLSVLDIINNTMSMIVVLVTYAANTFCQILTFLEYFGYGGSLVLTCCFAHALYVGTQGVRTQFLREYFRIYGIMAISAGIALATLTVATEYDQVDPANGFCWHYIHHEGFDWKDFCVSTLPLSFSIGFCAFCYLSVIKQLRNAIGRTFLELLLYPLILIVCYLPWVSWTVYASIAQTDKIPFAWLFIATIGSNSQGLFNAFAYGLSRRIVVGYREKCCNRRSREVFTASSDSRMPTLEKEKLDEVLYGSANQIRDSFEENVYRSKDGRQCDY